MTTKRRLMMNSASGLAERLINLAVQVWLYQYLIKRISPEEYSLLPVVAALLVFVPPFLVVLTSGISRDTVQAHARNDDQRVTEITSTMFPVLFATAVALVFVALVVARYLSSILKIAPENLFEARWMVLLMFGTLALRVLLLPFSTGLYIRQKFVAINGLTVAQALLRIALLFVLLFGKGPHVLWVVVASTGADAVIVLVTTALSVRALPALKFRLRSIRWELLSGLVSFGFWNMIASIAVIIRKSSDILVLNRFASPIDVNAFQLASLTDNQIDATMDRLQQPLQPHMVALYTKDGHAALRTFSARCGCYCLWVALLVATPLIAFRHELWSLYLGSKVEVYAAVPAVMVLLLARYWMECPFYLVGMAAFAMGRMRALGAIIIIQSVLNLAITIYFVHDRHMGPIGSALGTLVSVVIFVPVILVWTVDLLGGEFLPLLKTMLWRGALPSVIAGFFAWGWRYMVSPETVGELLTAAAIVASVYVLAILLFCLDEEERHQLKTAFAKVSSQQAYKALVSRIEF